MCTEYSPACTCFRSQAEYDEECHRIAIASAIEHDVFALLRDADAPGCSPHAHRFAQLIRTDPLTCEGVSIADILATDYGVFWWLADGSQCCARFDARPALRLAA